MWGRIIYHCFIQGKHMTKVTHDRVCLIYGLTCNAIGINVGRVIFSAIKKVCYLRGTDMTLEVCLLRF